MNILKEVNVGSHYFQVALLLRQAILLSSMLLNFDASLKLTQKNMRMLEKVDESLLRRVFSTLKSACLPSLYLESGSIPVRILIKGKRILFLHYLLNQDKNTLLSKMLHDQIDDPVENDWVSVTIENLKELGLDHYTFSDIKEMKKSRMKYLVKEACQDAALKYLTKEIEERNLKKMKNLKYSKLEIQEYLTCTEMTTTEKKLIFRARTGLLNLGFNMGQKIPCFACGLENDENQHVLNCVILKLSCPELMSNRSISFEDVYSTDLRKVKEVAKLLKVSMRAREILKSSLST